MAWAFLLIAGLLEVVWAYAMKLSDGFTKPMPTIIMAICMFISFFLLSVSMKTLPLGTAYPIWTGIGAVGTFVVGIAILNEPANALRIVAAVMIVGGLVLMKVATPS